MDMNRKIVLVTRKSRLDGLISRFNTLDQARFYIEHLGADFDDYVREHDRYYAALRLTRTLLEKRARIQLLDRGFLANFIFAEDDVIVALGQDGLVANTLKYLDGQLLLGVNPDPERWDGKLLPFETGDLEHIVPEVLAGKRGFREVTIAKAELTDGQVLLAVNDFFIGRRTHVSAQYELQVGDCREHQSSSGVIVSTGLGSTGWLTSVYTGAMGLLGGKSTGKLRATRSFDWESPRLCYAVREPYPSRATGTELVTGWVEEQATLKITSAMPADGVIFSDGMEHDYLAFDSGFVATVSVADKRGHLVQ